MKKLSNEMPVCIKRPLPPPAPPQVHASKQEHPEKIKAGKRCLGALIRAEQALRNYYIVQTRADEACEFSVDEILRLISYMSNCSQELHKKYDHLSY